MKANELGLAAAIRDIREGWDWRELWLTLGWRDVLTRHRQTLLGPMWIPISMAFIAGGMGLLYSGILGQPARDYIPYLVAGFMAWNFISSLVNEGKSGFVSNAGAIREIPVPGSVHIYRLIWKNVLILGFNGIVYLAVILIFGIWPFPAVFLVVPALALMLLNGIWVGLLLGLFNARFRDLGQLIPNAMRLAFFMTPIIWHADQVTGLREIFVHFNPLYYFVELLRAPLLGIAPSAMVWTVTLGITILGWAITLPVYARWRRQIAFWI